MPRRNPVVSNSTKKRLIHHNLMVRKDARKAIGSSRILEIGTKLPNPSGDIKRRVFCHWETSKKCSWVGNTLMRVLDSNDYFYT